MKVEREETTRPDCCTKTHSNGKRGSKRKSETCSNENDFKKIKKEYIALKQTFRDLAAKHCALQSKHEDLSQTHDQLVEEQAQLKKEHMDLEKKYAGLQKDHEKLKEGYDLEIHAHIDEMKTLERNVSAAYAEERRELKERVRNYRRRIKDMAQYAAAGGYGFEREYYSSDED